MFGPEALKIAANEGMNKSSAFHCYGAANTPKRIGLDG